MIVKGQNVTWWYKSGQANAITDGKISQKLAVRVKR